MAQPDPCATFLASIRDSGTKIKIRETFTALSAINIEKWVISAPAFGQYLYNFLSKQTELSEIRIKDLSQDSFNSAHLGSLMLFLAIYAQTHPIQILSISKLPGLNQDLGQLANIPAHTLHELEVDHISLERPSHGTNAFLKSLIFNQDNLHSVTFTHTQLPSIFDLTLANASIGQLDISHNQGVFAGDPLQPGPHYLTALIATNTLRLDSENNELESLKQWLNHNKIVLEKLDLSENEIDSKTLSALLKEQQSIQSLSLKNCRISFSEHPGLLKHILSLPLSHLDLSGNNLEGCGSYFERNPLALKRLVELKCGKSKLDDTLLTLILRKTNLEHLDISDNPIENTMLWTGLLKNQTKLSCLNIQKCDIDESSATDLIQFVAQKRYHGADVLVPESWDIPEFEAEPDMMAAQHTPQMTYRWTQMQSMQQSAVASYREPAALMGPGGQPGAHMQIE